MSNVDRRLLRAACSLQRAYAAVPKDYSRFELPEQGWEELRTTFRTWSTACERGWHATAARRRETLASDLEHLSNQLRNRVATLRQERLSQVPQLRLLYEELVAAADVFEEVAFEAGEISITTDSITLEDVELGRFKIRLQLGRLSAEAPYFTTALDPNPAGSCSETTHPHVSGERLCPGEGRTAIAAALAEGRLFDFFTIVDRILHTYAVGSAYVELEQWYGVRCHDCDSTVNEEDACTCTHCEERVCGDCLVNCGGCGDGFCSGCIDRCYRCEEYSCRGCLTNCTCCRKSVCSACCTDELCENCRELLEEDQDEAESENTLSGPPDPATESAI